MNNTEEWKTIPGYETYEVSSHGRIRSLSSRKRGSLLKPFPDNNGYLKVKLIKPVKGNKPKCLSLHRLIALTFLGECPEGQEVRHLDSVKSNLHLSNLAYGTHLENFQDGVGVQDGMCNRGEKNGQSKLATPDVLLIRLLSSFGWTQVKIAEIMEVGVGAIRDIISGRTWSHI